MVSSILCQLCCTPFDVCRIRKFNDHPDTAIAFNGPGKPRRLTNWGQHDDPEWEETLKQMAAAKTEESVHGLLGGEESCGADGCRHIGIAPDDDPLGHYAGPNCYCTGGYNGYIITAEEMLERSKLHCLTSNVDGEAPTATAADSQTSLCSFVEDGQWTNLSNMNQSTVRQADKADLPIHPSCFEMYKRMSMQRFGMVDLDGLWMFRDHDVYTFNLKALRDVWRGDESKVWTRFDGFPQATDLGIVLREESYHCHPGTEYLAADPVNVPGLDELISEASKGRASHLAFTSPRSGSHCPDIFSGLPIELRRMIAEALPRRDVANLRIASAAFTELPQSYFQHIIKSEIPWVWEIDSLPAKEVDWYNLWRRLSAADGGSFEDEKKRIWGRRQGRELQLRNHELRVELDRRLREGQPSKDQQKKYDDAMEAGRGHIMKQFRALKGCGMWKNDKKATELRGLRNRRRIYCDIEEILNRIQKLREANEGV